MSSAKHAKDLKKNGFIFNTIFLINTVFGCKSNARKWVLQYLILGKKHEFMSFDGLNLRKSLIFAGLPTPQP
jgi:lipoprotein